MPYRISRLGLVEIRSLDLDRDLDYYLNVLGLQLTAREGKTAYLKGWDERHATPSRSQSPIARGWSGWHFARWTRKISTTTRSG